MSEVNVAVSEIKALNPKPGNIGHTPNHTKYITPDIAVVNNENGFQMVMEEAGYPFFSISTYYSELFRTTEDKETKNYLKEKLHQAEEISRSIQQRTETIAEIAGIIVRCLQEFFLKGPGYQAPLSLSDLARQVQRHESTVSRTLHGKYLQCRWGVFPLSFFLTQAVTASAETGDAFTAEQIKTLLRNVIDGEDKRRPLSDEALRKKMEEQGVQLSRRTVNKYRREMGIPDQPGRKKND